jgi:hypothetical protein
MNLPYGGVFEEPIQRLTAISPLQGATGLLDGAKLRGAHPRPRRCLGHAFG